MAEEILVAKTIQCPACERQVPLWMANPRLYTVASRESDRHVTGYRWVHGLVTSVLPHHYKVWQCPKCLFADLAENLDKDRHGFNSDASLQAFRDIPIEKRTILDSLRELVPSGELDPKGAIATHLAALLIRALPATERQVDHSKLGQIALRLAWLFRELGDPSASATPGPGSDAVRALVEATEHLDQLLVEAGETLREIQQQGKRRTEELSPADISAANPYLPLGNMIEVRLQALRAEVVSLQMAVLQDQQGRTAQLKPLAQEGTGDLVKVLISLTPHWPKLPRSERQSLRLALEAFEYSYQFEDEGENVEQGVAQVNLILDILIRLGELERALDWTAQTSKYASETSADLKHRLDRAKASQTLSNYDSTAIHRKIAALNLTQQKAGERRRDVLALMLERDREKIDGVLGQTSQLSVRERMKALTEIGIHDGVLALLSKEMSGTPKEGSGWFKGLFHS